MNLENFYRASSFNPMNEFYFQRGLKFIPVWDSASLIQQTGKVSGMISLDPLSN
ncbi:hypothetical protein PQQ20_00850 [Methanosarcina mazei]|uniref:hypothetical protein n=1 Tax=Methanosarcina mazei TaxID=2209 RepID=UPI0012FF37E9|nr:hypothetical protein [Methanosarcina mazei]WIM43422.1 hypothetical protein PSF70_00850 [Methanosarcina mazei]WIM46873.1 hypothetical protein PQQ20_00850 [Methanosarcina mazei]